MDCLEKPGYDEAYASRSGIYGVENLCTHLAIIHGELDERVPVYQARNYIEAAKKHKKSHLVSYMELAGKGGAEHWSNTTEKDMDDMNLFSEQNRIKHRQPVSIAPKGKMKVLGYLVTKSFSVFCDSINDVAQISYDIEKNLFEISGECGCKIIRH